MNCYDSTGNRIELGSKCKFQNSEGEDRDGTVRAVGIVSYLAEDGGEPRVQWEVLVQDSSTDIQLPRNWIPASSVQITGGDQ